MTLPPKSRAAPSPLGPRGAKTIFFWPMSQKACALFAGQSVQEPGMGVELLKRPAARAVIERLKPSLGADLETLLTTTPDQTLALTYNAQRAIHASHVAHWLAYAETSPGLEL